MTITLAGQPAVKGTWGGVRPGATGRPRLCDGPHHHVKIRLTPAQIATADRLGSGNIGAGIRAALDMAADLPLGEPRTAWMIGSDGRYVSARITAAQAATATRLTSRDVWVGVAPGVRVALDAVPKEATNANH